MRTLRAAPLRPLVPFALAAVVVLVASPRIARAQDEATDNEMPPKEAPASMPVEALRPSGPPDKNRWEIGGGGELDFGSNPGAKVLQVEGRYSRILQRHLDAYAGLGLGFGSCCAPGGSSIDLPVTIGVRFYPSVKNEVTGASDASTGSTVRVMTGETPARSSAVYLLLDGGFELSVKTANVGSSSGLGWIVDLGLGFEHNLTNTTSIFGELRLQLNPGGVTYSGAQNGAGKLNGLLASAGYRF